MNSNSACRQFLYISVDILLEGLLLTFHHQLNGERLPEQIPNAAILRIRHGFKTAMTKRWVMNFGFVNNIQNFSSKSRAKQCLNVDLCFMSLFFTSSCISSLQSKNAFDFIFSGIMNMAICISTYRLILIFHFQVTKSLTTRHPSIYPRKKR